MSAHTPPPWGIGTTEWDYATVIVKDDKVIARCGSSDFLQAERDAGFIVRAVNSHEELIALAKDYYSDLNGFNAGTWTKERVAKAIANAEGK